MFRMYSIIVMSVFLLTTHAQAEDSSIHQMKHAAKMEVNLWEAVAAVYLHAIHFHDDHYKEHPDFALDDFDDDVATFEKSFKHLSESLSQADKNQIGASWEKVKALALAVNRNVGRTDMDHHDEHVALWNEAEKLDHLIDELIEKMHD